MISFKPSLCRDVSPDQSSISRTQTELAAVAAGGTVVVAAGPRRAGEAVTYTAKSQINLNLAN